MLIDFNLYLNHPYYKKISDYFDHIELENSLSRFCTFKIHDLDLTDQLLKETEFIETEHQMINYVNYKMKYLVSSIVYKMTHKHGFNDHESGVNLDKYTNKIKVSLYKNHLPSFVKSIEKTINGKNFVFNHKISVEDVDDEGLCEHFYVDLFEINLDNFSFEDIDKQLEEYAKIKDQLISELQNM